MKLNWQGDAATAALRKRLAANLYNFNDKILDQARADISTPGPPASEPGNAPHVDSGRMRDSLFGAVDESNLQSLVGSTEDHAYYTEVGTPTMAERPWFTPAILESLDDAAQELVR